MGGVLKRIPHFLWVFIEKHSLTEYRLSQALDYVS